MADTVCDTSPIQYLHQARLLHLLPAIYGRLVIPVAVLKEIAEGRARGIHLPELSALDWAQIEAPRNPGLLPLVADLGPGEGEVLALAVERPDSLVILDDGLARRYAARLGVRVVGTLGILLRAKKSGLILAVSPVLDQLDQLRFRVDAETRSAVLRLAGE